jgi:hypothetical protein
MQWVVADKIDWLDRQPLHAWAKGRRPHLRSPSYSFIHPNSPASIPMEVDYDVIHRVVQR